MRRVLIVALSAALIPAVAAAQTEPTPLADFTSLCEETARTGFIRLGDAWDQSEFPPESFVVRKVSNAADRQALWDYCTSGSRKEAIATRWSFSTVGCYRVGRPLPFIWCDEFYQQQRGVWAISGITCGDTVFVPQGFFHSSRVTYAPSADRTGDSIIEGYRTLEVSYGKCSLIQ
jgi:hypothetical protein